MYTVLSFFQAIGTAKLLLASPFLIKNDVIDDQPLMQPPCCPVRQRLRQHSSGGAG